MPIINGETRQVINDTAQTATYNAGGDNGISKKSFRSFSLQAVWTAAAITGASIKIQASDNQSTWEDVPSTTQTISGNGSHIWNLRDQYYHFYRFTITIGTGTLDTLQVWETQYDA